MLKNMITVAIRTLLKQRFYTFLNLTGLAVGLSVFLTIVLIISNQMSYDQFHAKTDRIYRIDQTFIWGDAYPKFGSTGPAVAESIRTNVPGVEKVSRVYTIGEKLVSVPSLPEKVANEETDIMAVDSSFLSIFSFTMVHGDEKTALNEPFTAVITESTAKKYFGNTEAIGQLLKIGNGRMEGLFKITGIVRDVPSTSHFTFNIITSMSSFPEVAARNKTWFWSGFVTYALLAENADAGVARDVLYDMPSQYAGQAYENVTSNGKEWHLYLQPLKDIWLHTVDSPNRLGATGNILYIYILMAIALMVLILAVVNYMNMATARSVKRAKEVGIRKVMGALKGQLLTQFLSESFILVILAAGLALVAVELAIPYFSTLAGFELSVFTLFNSYTNIAFLVAIIIATALLAGAYPAFFMAKFSPIQALRKSSGTGKSGKLLRSGLVVFQFTVSISLVVLSFIVFEQLSFLQNKDLGFDKDNLIIVPQVQRMDSARRVSFQQELANHPSVKLVGMSTSVPPSVWDGDSFATEEDATTFVPLSYMNVSKTYMQTLGVEMLHGRAFSEAYEADGTNVLLNENAITALGWVNDESVLGKKLVYGNTRFNVIGVMKNFHYRSLDGPIEPLAIFQYGAPLFHSNSNYLSIRLNPAANNMAETEKFLAYLESQWEVFAPGLPFGYRFTDDMYFQAFEFEQRLGNIFSAFTLLAIIIACMGLLGLAAYMAEVRTKEIGIRKVLGATVSQLVVLLNGDFAKLVVIAFIISVPLSWYVGDVWLQNYEYRTAIDWKLFAYAGASALAIALLTVSYQSIKSALANPVDVLHDE